MHKKMTKSATIVKCPCCDLTGRQASISTHVRYVHTSEEYYRKNFFAKVNKNAPGGCWIWTGCLDSWERGALTVRGRRTFAHRVSWEIAHGVPPKGLFICHTCDIRACCNPAHMFLGTARDNNWDRARKFRTARIKFNREDIIEIRKLLGTMMQKDIAARYGVAHGLISRIKLGKSYRHVA